MEVPSSIQRIEAFPSSVLALLNRIPPSGDVEQIFDVLEREPLLLAEIRTRAIVPNGEEVVEELDYPALIDRIGAPKLFEIALTLLVQGYLQRAIRVSEHRLYWRYTLACAVCCAEIAPAGQVDKLTAYAAGLLHDIGRLALVAAYPDRYANLLILTDSMFRQGLSFDLLNYERNLYGLDHFETGSWLAAHWGMPPWLQAITGKFAKEAEGVHRQMVATVRSGTSLAHSLGFGYLQAAPRAEIRKILDRLPSGWNRGHKSDAWKQVEEHLRKKIQSQLNLYSIAPAAD